MRRVVIDTNVVIKGFFVPGSKHARIVEQVARGGVRLFYSLGMIEELIEVANYPKVKKYFKIHSEDLFEAAVRIRKRGTIVKPEETNLCRDVKDNMVLGTAMAAAKFGHTFLVTEDEDLSALVGKVEKVKIVQPGEFLKEHAGSGK